MISTVQAGVGAAHSYENALPIYRPTGHRELSPPFPPEGQDASSVYRNYLACGVFPALPCDAGPSEQLSGRQRSLPKDMVGDDARPYKKATSPSQLPREALPLAFVPTVTRKGRR
jgi:hypothetical protein